MARRNVFLAPETSIDERFRQMASLLAEFGHILPASLQADADSYYACTGDGAESTQDRLLFRTSLVMLLARTEGFDGHRLTADTIVELHDGIFRPVFGDRTLGFRSPPGRNVHRDDDGVEFPYWVVPGPGRGPEIRTRRGIRSGQVPRRVREACEKFERDAPAAIGDVDSGALVIAQLYVRLIRTHPFGDGNGRTAWAAVQLAAGRLRLPFVKSDPTTDARVALGDALRHGERIGPLATAIRTAMWGEGEAEALRNRVR